MKKIVVLLMFICLGKVSAQTSMQDFRCENMILKYPSKWTVKAMDKTNTVFWECTSVYFSNSSATIDIEWFPNNYDLSMDFIAHLYQKKLQEKSNQTLKFKKIHSDTVCYLYQVNAGETHSLLSIYKKEHLFFVAMGYGLKKQKDKDFFSNCITEITIQEQSKPTLFLQEQLSSIVEKPIPQQEKQADNLLPQIVEAKTLSDNTKPISHAVTQTASNTLKQELIAENSFEKQEQEKKLNKEQLPTSSFVSEFENKERKINVVLLKNFEIAKKNHQTLKEELKEELEEKQLIANIEKTKKDTSLTYHFASHNLNYQTLLSANRSNWQPAQEGENNTILETLPNISKIGKTGVCNNLTFSYPLNWIQVSKKQLAEGFWEVVLMSAKYQYAILRKENKQSENGYEQSKEETIKQNLPTIAFEEKINYCYTIHNQKISYKNFILEEKGLYGCLAFIDVGQNRYSITLQAVEPIDFLQQDYNTLINNLKKSERKETNNSLKIKNISFNLPKGYSIKNYNQDIKDSLTLSFETVNPAKGSAHLYFTVIEKDVNLLAFTQEHYQKKQKDFSDWDNIQINTLDDFSIYYYTMSNEDARYCVSVSFYYKGKTFLIEVFTNALKDKFFEDSSFINLLKSIEVDA